MTSVCLLDCLKKHKPSPPLTEVSTETLMVERVDALPDAIWDELGREEAPFLNYAYLKVLEEALEGQVHFRYVLKAVAGRPLILAYYQIMYVGPEQLTPFSTQGQGWKARLSNWTQQVIIRPHHRLLLLGNAFVSGDLGIWHAPEVSRQAALAFQLEHELSIRQHHPHIIGSLIKDLAPKSLNAAKDFHAFQVDPLMEVQINPEWADLEDYLQSLKTKYRQRQRSVYKKSKELLCVELQADEIAARQEEMNALLAEVLRKDRFNLQATPPSYFHDMKRALGEDFLVKAYFLQGRMLAFSTAFVTDREVYAHMVGYKTALNHSYKLYQRLLCDLLEESIVGGQQRLDLGRTAMEIKSCLGATAQPLELGLCIHNAVGHRFAGPIMRRLTPDTWTPRHPFKAQ